RSARISSWDLLGGARKIGQAYEQFDPRNASEQHLAFADGDLPTTNVVRDRTFASDDASRRRAFFFFSSFASTSSF
ncbi:hypothetical protein F5148DRAFT_990343, partial [Russula earlei]